MDWKGSKSRRLDHGTTRTDKGSDILKENGRREATRRTSTRLRGVAGGEGTHTVSRYVVGVCATPSRHRGTRGPRARVTVTRPVRPGSPGTSTTIVISSRVGGLPGRSVTVSGGRGVVTPSGRGDVSRDRVGSVKRPPTPETCHSSTGKTSCQPGTKYRYVFRLTPLSLSGFIGIYAPPEFTGQYLRRDDSPIF